MKSQYYFDQYRKAKEKAFGFRRLYNGTGGKFYLDMSHAYTEFSLGFYRLYKQRLILEKANIV